MRWKRILPSALLTGLMAGLLPITAMGQEPPPPSSPQVQRPAGGQRGRGQLPQVRPGMPIQQLQAMFDAYALVQAQRALRLSDEQYQRFFMRMNRLQDV